MSTEIMIDVPPPKKTTKNKTHGGPHIMLINSSTLIVFGYTSVENALNNKMSYSICGIFSHLYKRSSWILIISPLWGLKVERVFDF